jgi:adenylate cyclase
VFSSEPELNRHRVAVLPFANMSPDPKDEYFADGLTEELITKLSEISELRVIARTSIMNYKRKEKKISEIGRELNVGSIIEGSVRKAGNKIRVTAQLVDAKTEEHLWASNYDRELDDIFAIQSDVASRVSGSLIGGVFANARKDTTDIEAYTSYMRGMQLYHEGTESSLREAIVHFDRAISRDPAFVRAYVGLAGVWIQLARSGYEDYSVVSGKAEVAAHKALEVGPDSAEGHAIMADIHRLLDRFDESRSEAEKAIERNPNVSDAYIALGTVYSSTGKLDRGLSFFQKAYELDPLAFHIQEQLAWVYQLAGREDEALEILRKMKELYPRNPKVYDNLAGSHMMKGEFAKAQEMLDKGLSINPDEPALILDQGLLYALTGRRKEAEEMLQQITNNRNENVRLYGQLHIQAALGNLDEAFKALMRQAETHSWPFLLKSSPVLDGLRRDPRFIEFCKKVGLPP